MLPEVVKPYHQDAKDGVALQTRECFGCGFRIARDEIEKKLCQVTQGTLRCA